MTAKPSVSDDNKGLGAPAAASQGEEWRAAPGWDGLYEVSNMGRVRSLHRDPRVVSTFPNGDGYTTVYLYPGNGGKRRGVAVHRLVCRAFHGEPFSIWNEAAHRDGNRANPRASNLKWSTKVENRSHRILHGTHSAGEQHPCAKLTEPDVRVIKARLAAGEGYTAISRDYPVSAASVRDIKRGRNWRHVSIERAAA